MPTSRIDWNALIKRQEAAFAATVQQSRSSDQEQEILMERAARLAARQTSEQEARECIDCLEFLLSGERYAIELAYISETLPLAEFTPLFCTPPFVLGIINLRGRIISIIDLRRFFDISCTALSDLNRVIVVGDGSMEFGVLADSVEGMRCINRKDLLPAPDAFTGFREEFLAGVTIERLALLDIGKVLSDPRIVVREDVA